MVSRESISVTPHPFKLMRRSTQTSKLRENADGLVCFSTGEGEEFVVGESVGVVTCNGVHVCLADLVLPLLPDRERWRSKEWTRGLRILPWKGTEQVEPKEGRDHGQGNRDSQVNHSPTGHRERRDERVRFRDDWINVYRYKQTIDNSSVYNGSREAEDFPYRPARRAPVPRIASHKKTRLYLRLICRATDETASLVILESLRVIISSSTLLAALKRWTQSLKHTGTTSEH